MLGLTRYQWTVLFAAWLGWGFDIFDSLLFNFVAPNCIPTLLGLPIGSKAAAAATSQWTGILTSLMLVGWAAGGVLFGYIGDRLGRTRTLMLTMVMYALGTAACAFAPNLGVLIVFRIIASLGIGGEWAAGASMVAEVMPEKRRVDAGVLLYTAASIGLFLATGLNYLVAASWFPDSPEKSWRYLFLFGLVPAAVAFAVRAFVREPERWAQQQSKHSNAGGIALREIFTGPLRRVTLWGTFVTVIALVTWWSSNAFISPIATTLARAEAEVRSLGTSATLALVANWKLKANLYFNAGGLVGTLLVIPLARALSRRALFALYLAGSAVAMLLTFGMQWQPETRLMLYFVVGVPVFGIFGAFPFYLPELFPTRLRATGSGFCYNIGRLIAAIGPFVVGTVAAKGAALSAIFYVGFVPLIGLLFAPFFIETRGRALQD
jgi:MFS family permease